ncbi:unnamed protein product [Rotaria sordida]|uniref:TTF-type domain-containing protein n=1 Tax=Rotaria sordida TaxID=392033 RepID=A0A814XI95_9BILA|nr:unnamed protein product [Rotaria sordida]
MDNNKRRTSSIDSYFSVQKKTKSQDDALNYVNVNNDSIVSTSSPTSSSLISIPVPDVALVNLNNINNSVQNNPVGDDISRSHIDPPCQPILDKYPINEDNRSFQARWYHERPWLEYSKKTDSVFCYNCRHFGDTTAPKRKKDDVFVIGGFRKWKCVLEKKKGFDQHIKSQNHIIATTNYLSYQQRIKTNQTVIDILDSGRIQHIRQNRTRLIKIASLLLLCCRQMIPIRGHNENENSSNRGNLLEILRWSSDVDPISKAVLEDSAQNATYLSHHIQNELIGIMANTVREQISNLIRGKYFALTADESRDVSGHEQLSIVIRIVNDPSDNNNDIIKEYFMGWDSINSLIQNYSAIIEAFEDIIAEGDSRSVNARGLLISVKEPIFICTLFILHKLMGPIKILSNQLKSGTIDDGKASVLILSIIDQMKNLRNEESFKSIYDQIIQFCQTYDIDIKQKRKRCRTRIMLARFANSIITSTVGHRDDDANDEYRIRTSIYYPLIDAILIELNDRFSNSNLNLLTSLSSLYPENESFLEFQSLSKFADHFNCDRNQLENELNVIKPMVKDDKLNSIAELYKKLTPYKNAFPTAVCMVAGALTVPVSSTTFNRDLALIGIEDNNINNFTFEPSLTITILDIYYMNMGCVFFILSSHDIIKSERQDYDDYIELLINEKKNFMNKYQLDISIYEKLLTIYFMQTKYEKSNKLLNKWPSNIYNLNYIEQLVRLQTNDEQKLKLLLECSVAIVEKQGNNERSTNISINRKQLHRDILPNIEKLRLI